MRVAARDLGVARLARRRRVAQQVGDVVLVHVRRPEPRGEGVPEVVEVEIANPGLLHCPLEADHQLASLPPRTLRVEDQFIVGCVLPRNHCYKVLVLLSVTSAVVTSWGCLPALPPSFSGRIRIHALQATVGPLLEMALLPMPGVPNRGRLLTRRSNLSSGTRSVFQGVTNAFGLSDYPDAITDAQWSVGIGPSAAPRAWRPPSLRMCRFRAGSSSSSATSEARCASWREDCYACAWR